MTAANVRDKVLAALDPASRSEVERIARAHELQAWDPVWVMAAIVCAAVRNVPLSTIEASEPTNPLVLAGWLVGFFVIGALFGFSACYLMK